MKVLEGEKLYDAVNAEDGENVFEAVNLAVGMREAVNCFVGENVFDAVNLLVGENFPVPENCLDDEK